MKNSLEYYLQEINDRELQISRLKESIAATKKAALNDWGALRPGCIIVFDGRRYIITDYHLHYGVDGPLDIAYDMAELRKDSQDRYYHSRQRTIQQRLLNKVGFGIEFGMGKSINV